ncbi:hypothetical protein G5I_00432 [Acromyrmex echinatior]|uniref:Uncharacterized protein n=1 Tax=Acromyrmex echinatior TaxID=103372 RepID=F4W4V5_ACREC|nr:hypothetical protein G5I_00432 [Acromyrmex echinatior]
MSTQRGISPHRRKGPCGNEVDGIARSLSGKQEETEQALFRRLSRLDHVDISMIVRATAGPEIKKCQKGLGRQASQIDFQKAQPGCPLGIALGIA